MEKKMDKWKIKVVGYSLKIKMEKSIQGLI